MPGRVAMEFVTEVLCTPRRMLISASHLFGARREDRPSRAQVTTRRSVQSYLEANNESGNSKQAPRKVVELTPCDAPDFRSIQGRHFAQDLKIIRRLTTRSS